MREEMVLKKRWKRSGRRAKRQSFLRREGKQEEEEGFGERCRFGVEQLGERKKKKKFGANSQTGKVKFPWK